MQTASVKSVPLARVTFTCGIALRPGERPISEFKTDNDTNLDYLPDFGVVLITRVGAHKAVPREHVLHWQFFKSSEMEEAPEPTALTSPEPTGKMS